jgi:hypothetical protein
MVASRREKRKRTRKKGNIFTAGGTAVHSCVACRGDILPGQAYKRCGKKKWHHVPACDCAGAMLADESSLWNGKRVGGSVLAFLTGRRQSVMGDDYWRALFRFLQKGRRLVCIRCFDAHAREEYDCYDCLHSPHAAQWDFAKIFPGEFYRGEVYVGDHGWEVRRYHHSCPFDPYEDHFRKEIEDSEPDPEPEPAPEAEPLMVAA